MSAAAQPWPSHQGTAHYLRFQQARSRLLARRQAARLAQAAFKMHAASLVNAQTSAQVHASTQVPVPAYANVLVLLKLLPLSGPPSGFPAPGSQPANFQPIPGQPPAAFSKVLIYIY